MQKPQHVFVGIQNKDGCPQMNSKQHSHKPILQDKCLMKQPDDVVNPPDFVWDPNLTLTHMTVDLDPRRQTESDA